MKLEQKSGLHLTYCTNIHPGEDWQQVYANLQQYVPALKTRLAPTAPFGIGLRLSNKAAQQLLERDNLPQFQSWLAEQSLYVFTLNGFPYGGFHRQSVKDRVYAPDWSERSRLDYTIRLASILAALLPESMDGGISTVPLSYKPWWKEKQMSEAILKDSSINLALAVAEIIRIQGETGKLLHLDLEPEPDGLIENAAEVIDFFHNWLFPIGGACLAKCRGISQAAAEARLLEHVRVCYDTCHFAVEYEDPAAVFNQFQSAGIQIGKIQISAAVKVVVPDNLLELNQVAERLRPFAESTYLHQVIAHRADGTLHHYPDLQTALPYLEQSTDQEWRIHFHVPIFIRDYQVLQSTQDDILTVLKLLEINHACKYLEIETYTWDVLPSNMKLDLLDSIQREYEWVLTAIAAI